MTWFYIEGEQITGVWAACVCVCCSQVISPEKPGNHIFRLTGPGADRDPKGLFTIDIDTGDVSVSRSLDREAIDSYQVSTCVNSCEKHLPIPFVFFSSLFTRVCTLPLIIWYNVTFCVFPMFCFVHIYPVKVLMWIYCSKKKGALMFMCMERLLWSGLFKSSLICNQMTQTAGSEIWENKGVLYLFQPKWCYQKQELDLLF